MTSRRAFLKQAAMATAAAAASRLALGDGPRTAAAAPAGDGVTWAKAPCRFCGTGCHVQVGTRGGRVVAIQGDQKAEVNRGLLCVKGYHVGLALYGADRLRRPLLRKGGRLEPISWPQAIDVIARRAAANPAGFALYGSGQWTIPEGYAAAKFIKGGFGHHQLESNARLCMSSAVTGFMATYGVDEPAGCYDDLDHCTALVTWGNNPAEMHPVLFSRFVDRRTRGEKVALVDLNTRRTRTSQFADRSVLFRPNTEVALVNGIAHLLIARGTFDRRFVEAHCGFRAPDEKKTLFGRAIAFEEYARLVADYAPAKVEQVTGVAAADLHFLADLFGQRDARITSLWCMGLNQHTRGTAANAAVHGLHLLSGHFGRPGDAPTSLTGQPSACGTVREVGTLCHLLPGGLAVANADDRREAEHLWGLPPGRISDKIGYHTVEMWRRFSTPREGGGDIDTVWVQTTNPAQSLPNVHELFEPSRRLDGKFLIVSDVYPTATTRAADLVLPSALWVEKNGMFGNSERRTQQWFKMVEPRARRAATSGRSWRSPAACTTSASPACETRPGGSSFASSATAPRCPSGTPSASTRSTSTRHSSKSTGSSRPTTAKTLPPTPSTSKRGGCAGPSYGSPTARGARRASASPRATTPTCGPGRASNSTSLILAMTARRSGSTPTSPRPSPPTPSTPSGCVPGVSSSTGTRAR